MWTDRFRSSRHLQACTGKGEEEGGRRPHRRPNSIGRPRRSKRRWAGSRSCSFRFPGTRRVRNNRSLLRTVG
jgi:hypothetical protein